MSDDKPTKLRKQVVDTAFEHWWTAQEDSSQALSAKEAARKAFVSAYYREPPSKTPDAKSQRLAAIALVKDVNKVTGNMIRDLRGRIQKNGYRTKAEAAAMHMLKLRASVLCMTRCALRNMGRPEGCEAPFKVHCDFSKDEQYIIAAALLRHMFAICDGAHNPMYVDVALVTTMRDAIHTITQMRGVRVMAELFSMPDKRELH